MNDLSRIDTSTAEALPIPAPKRRGRPPGTTKAAMAQRAAAEAAGQTNCETHLSPASGDNSEAPRQRTAKVLRSEPKADVDAALSSPPAMEEDDRFTDPLVAQIVQAHRMRRRWMKARNALILQGKAFGRALVGGDKEAGAALYNDVAAGKSRDNMAVFALAPFAAGAQGIQENIDGVEKTLSKLAKGLPVARYIEDVSGFGIASLAAFVGECGDFSAYRSVSAVWKRAGLAVIDGERQRKCADLEKAERHGYSPERRSVFWVAADAMSKHQRSWVDKETGEIKKPAGRYGDVLEREKAKGLAKGWTKARAEAHGKRLMTKALLRDLWLEWRRQVGKTVTEPFERRDPASTD